MSKTRISEKQERSKTKISELVNFKDEREITLLVIEFFNLNFHLILFKEFNKTKKQIKSFLRIIKQTQTR
jgi:hypothetical protein